MPNSVRVAIDPVAVASAAIGGDAGGLLTTGAGGGARTGGGVGATTTGGGVALTGGAGARAGGKGDAPGLGAPPRSDPGGFGIEPVTSSRLRSSAVPRVASRSRSA